MKRGGWSIQNIFSIVAVVMILAVGGRGVYAQKKKVIPPKSKIVLRLEEQRKKMMAEIKSMSNELTKTTRSAKSSLRKLNLLMRQIETQKEMIATLTKEVEEADRNIKELGLQIDSLNVEFEGRQKNYVKSLRAMSLKRNAKDQLLFYLSSEDFAQSFRRLRYLKQYSSWQKKEAEMLKALRAELTLKQEQLQAQREEKQKLLDLREEERKKLQDTEKKNREEVKKLQGRQSELRKEINRKERQAKQLNKKIQDQIAKEIAEAERKAREAERARKQREAEARKRKEGQKPSKPQTETVEKPSRKAATKGGYAMTKEEWNLSNSFEKNKGKLPMPVTGQYRIVGTFGQQSHSQLRNIQINSDGIDVETPPGGEARSVFDGVVTRIFVVEGYNNSIIVRHGNYLTVYSNLSSVYVKQGQKVSTGQKLGKIYEDADLGGVCQLHFQLWKERNKQNPLPWLSR